MTPIWDDGEFWEFDAVECETDDLLELFEVSLVNGGEIEQADTVSFGNLPLSHALGVWWWR